MSDEIKCPLCGKDIFTATEGDTHRWMWISCEECDLSLEVRKADYARDCIDPANLTPAKAYWHSTANKAREKVLIAYTAEIAAVLDGVVNQLPVNPDEKAFATQAYTNGAIDAIAAIRERLQGGKENG